LEIVPRRERVSQPPPLSKEVYEWDEPAEQSTEYGVFQKEPAESGEERSAELLKLAQTRFDEGQILEASALLKQVKSDLKTSASIRPAFDRLSKRIEARKQSIRDRCKALVDARNSDQLVAFLAGQASNELDPEEICAVALDAAQSLFQAYHAEGASELLRLAPFRTLREEALVREHRELELRVHRLRARQHALKSFLFLGGIVVAGTVGLALFALTIWNVGTTTILLVLVCILMVAATLIALIPQWRVWFQSAIAESTGRSTSADKLASFLKNRRK
jgi:hypothetical protein